MALIQLDSLFSGVQEKKTEKLVDVTPAAVERVKGMLAAKPGMEGKGLRIYVTNGGCAGYSYGMAFDDAGEHDTVADCGGLSVLVDPESLPWLRGVRVDYQESLLGSGFAITNPNAVSSCGCGTSFSKGDSAPASSGDSCH